jgi:ABC-type transport system involved in multi-copper enzyme maturation permease subunit
MHATWAILLDTYRELRTKRLFWISLILSAVLVLAMAATGINENGLTILHWELGSFGGVLTSDLISPAQFYKLAFINLGVGIWLTWGAVILALVSTAGLVPDMISSGAIETTLSKPISRTRLLLSKFAGGLLFGSLQVAVFSLASFLVIGIRGGSWEPAVFLAIPLVVLVNSYLLCVCFLAGLLTRSTITAPIITLLFWFAVFVVNSTDAIMIAQSESSKVRIETLDQRIERDQARLETVRPEQRLALENTIAERKDRKTNIEASAARLERWVHLPVVAKTLLPKTQETTNLLARTLRAQLRNSATTDAERAQLEPEDTPNTPAFEMLSREEQRILEQRIEDRYDARSTWWVLGTSIAFVAAVLGLTCFIFHRRDF